MALVCPSCGDRTAGQCSNPLCKDFGKAVVESIAPARPQHVKDQPVLAARADSTAEVIRTQDTQRDDAREIECQPEPAAAPGIDFVLHAGGVFMGLITAVVAMFATVFYCRLAGPNVIGLGELAIAVSIAGGLSGWLGYKLVVTGRSLYLMAALIGFVAYASLFKPEIWKPSRILPESRSSNQSR